MALGCKYMMRIRTLCLIAVCAFAWALPGYAQNVTTGTITGIVKDAQGGVLPGATVVATQTQAGINVNLGQSTAVEFTLQLESLTETVTVTADASSLFSPSMAGTSANIEQGVIESLPTVQRSFQDFARVNPFFVPNASNADPSALSVAGRNTRYNNIQIDGAVNNDVFGLASTGTPGGPADTQPI